MASNTVVQTNVLALNAHRNLGMVGNVKSKASQKLSSGYRINSAADDAAGLAISEKMRAQIRGLDGASKNTQDAISLIQTAEGGLSTINDMVKRIRDLVEDASNDTKEATGEEGDWQDRQKIQDEINSLIEGIDAIAGDTEFNKKRLLEGDYNSKDQKNIDDIRKYIGTLSADKTDETPAANETASKPKVDMKELQKQAAAALEKTLSNTNGAYSTFLDALGSTPATGVGGVFDTPTGASGTSVATEAAAVYSAIDTAVKAGNKVTEEQITDIMDKIDTLTQAMDGQILSEPASKAYDALGVLKESLTEITEIFHPDMGFPGTVGNAKNMFSSLDKVLAIEVGMSDESSSKKVTLGKLLGLISTGDAAADLGSAAAATSGLPALKSAWKDLAAATASEGMEAAYDDFMGALKEFLKDDTNLVTTGGTSTKLLANSVNWDKTEADVSKAVKQLLADKLAAFETPTLNAAAGKTDNLETDVKAMLSTVIGHKTGVAAGTDVTLMSVLTADTAAKDAYNKLMSATTQEDMESLFSDFITSVDAYMMKSETLDASGTLYHATLLPTYDLTALTKNTQKVLQDKLNVPGIKLELDADDGNSKNIGTSYTAMMGATIGEITSGGANITLEKILNEAAADDPATNPLTKQAKAVARALDTMNKAETVDDMNAAAENLLKAIDAYAVPKLGTATVATNVKYDLSGFADKLTTMLNNKLAGLGTQETPTPTQPPDAGNTLWFQIGANSGQGISVNINSVNSNALGLGDGKGQAWVDVLNTTGEDINTMLTGIDDALSYVTAERSKLGAIQNRLEYTYNNLNVASENLSNAESGIRDTDMAKEMMNLTKANIIQQAATSMLAQANQAPQGVLSLLQ